MSELHLLQVAEALSIPALYLRERDSTDAGSSVRTALHPMYTGLTSPESTIGLYCTCLQGVPDAKII